MSDVVVVGGGILGLLSALELTQRQRSVTIIDAPNAFPPASWAGGGILTPLYAWRYADAMTRLSHDAGKRFQQILQGIDPSGQSSSKLLNHGGVWAEVSEPEMAEAVHWAKRWEVSVEKRMSGALMPSVKSREGLYFPGLWNIRNPGLLKLLRSHLSRLGANIVHAQVDKVSGSDAMACVSSTDGRHWFADQVLLSAGAGMEGFLRAEGLSLDLFPVKGEMLLYQMQPGQVPAVMLTEQGYLIPRNDGAVLVGSTLQKGDRSVYPTVAGRYQLEALAADLWPELADHKPRYHWAGVRPGCGRDYPYIGLVPGRRNVFAAAGHFRNGLVSAPASAELLAQLMCQEKPFTDPFVYSLPASSLSSSSFFSR